MGKVHFSHTCPLTTPEIECDGICNICLKEEPIHFTCKPCNFDLCNGCSKLPQKVSDGFHSQHPLEFCLFQYDRNPGYIICSGCGNMSSCSFYECKKCEIYLDLSCALLENITTSWDVREMLHYSHEHLLRRCRPGPDARGSCLLCELPLSPSSICYGCVYCYSFLHNRCLDLPMEIQHPVHPEHPLRRLDYINVIKSSRVSCIACGENFDSVPFSCRECNFDIHMRCADSVLRGLMHKSHEHRLFHLVSTSKVMFGPCHMCKGKQGLRDHFYSQFRCIECHLEFHFDCLGIPEFVIKRSCHIHPLVCTRFPLVIVCTIFPEEDDSLEYCCICETVVHAGLHVYSCEQCDFLGHIECVLSEGEPSPLYLKDLYSSRQDITRARSREDNETNQLGNKIMINDFNHNHVMRAFDMDEFVLDEKCGICKNVILGDPWKCETCKFFCHKFCVELGKPSRHRFHWNHSLTLLPKRLTREKRSCDSCREDINGFNLFCRICNFIIHVTCAMKGTRFLGLVGPKVVGIWRGRCLKGKHRMVQVMFSKSSQTVCSLCQKKVSVKVVSCMECEYILHLRCFDGLTSSVPSEDSDDSSELDSASSSKTTYHV